MTDEARQLWDKVIDGLQGRVGPQMIDKLLRPLDPLDAADGVLLLRAPNDFARDWVTKGYAPLIEDTLRYLTGTPWTLCWTASTATSAQAAPKLPVLRQAPAPRPASPRPAPAVARPQTAPIAAPASPNAAPGAAPGVPPGAAIAGPDPGSSRNGPALKVSPEKLSQEPPRMQRPAAARSTGHTPTALRPGAALGGSGAGLSPRYTFDQFVIGPTNQIAYASAEALANLQGRRFNVLFLCGGTGLGKTHLSNAVGHRVLEQKPDAKIVYVSAEAFTNDYVQAIQQKKMDEFRTRYRAECDVLLIDDVQFLAGREGTQEEFFHTFNALTQRNAAIVLTSDVLPEKLQGMAERLLSRFQQGLVAEITTPETETRVAILRKKAELENVRLDDDAAFLIAGAVNANVRELEGTLMKLAIRAGIAGRPAIDAGLVRETLRVSARPAVVTVEDIQRAVAEYYRIKVSQLVGKERHREVALPRQVAMFIARSYLGTSFPQIGARFGGKDHTTVMSAVRRIEKAHRDEPELAQTLEALCAKLGFNPAQPVVSAYGASE
ncbi:MAG: chromosomal replication initiator protein DnaA [Myxococcales bacterium]|nr:chromosomal replication initiator protein DnaA [Myxococcales bacterium]